MNERGSNVPRPTEGLVSATRRAFLRGGLALGAVAYAALEADSARGQ